MPKKRYLDNAGKQDYQDVIRNVSNKQQSYADRLGKADEILPYINSKARVLTNAGRATGANVSMNRLDSIAKYAGLVGLPITDAIGIAVKENTLGNPTENQSAKKLSRALRNANYPTEQQIDNGSRQWRMSDFINYFRGYERNPYNELFNNTDNGRNEEKLRAGLKYADNKAKDIDLRPFFQQGFEFYKNHPNSYNPCQSNYSTLVRKAGNEVFQSPEIKDWWDKSGYYWYNGFIDNGWDKVDYVKPNEIRVDPSTGEVVTPNLRGSIILPEVNIYGSRMRRTLANGGGIHINSANRSKSTANNKKMYHGTRHNYYGSYYNDMVDEDGNPLDFNYYDKDGRAHYINKATGETYTSYKGDYNEGGITIRPNNYRSSYDPNGVTDFMNLFTLGAGNRLSVSQNLRLAKDTYDAISGNKSWKDVFNSAVFGNSGIFSNPNYNLALDIISPTLAYSTYKLPSLLRNYSLGIPNKTGRYFRIVGNASTPQGDAIADANATGIIRSNAKRVNVGQSKSGRRFTFGKGYSYPMFSKDKVWQGSTGIGESLGKTDRIIRTKADTGPTVWEESRIDFNHKNHAGIFRPNYLGDINAFPTRYAEWWERIGNNPITRHIWKRHDFDNVEFRNGGSIHINPANRGKFTATMQRTGKTAEELSHSSNPLTRKRAIFALNARKWNH